jgi:glycosyltransferase involved in cell wall biosynthesis
MELGVPVLAADLPYARENCGDAALFFEATNQEDLENQLSRILTDPTLRKQLIDGGDELIKKRREERPYERMVSDLVSLARLNSADS